MTLALIDERISPDARAALEDGGFHTLTVPACMGLPEATRSHPDMLLFPLGDNIFTEEGYLAENKDFFAELCAAAPRLKITPITESLSSEYPRDCVLNVLSVGDRLFLKSDSVSRTVLDEINRQGIRTVSVKQGYPACTVLALGDAHAITADRGMARALLADGVEVLKISDGGILLPPYDYGFIGGAAGVYGDKIYFIGDYLTHPDGENIRAFAEAAGYTAVSLDAGQLRDLGRIIFIDTDKQN